MNKVSRTHAPKPTSFDRPLYSERIRPFIGQGVIKVLTGQRRVGKSCLLVRLAELVRQQSPGTRIAYLNRELPEFAPIDTAAELIRWCDEQFSGSDSNALFVDEVQEIEGFETALRGLLARGNCDIFCTGSNAQMLSGELATRLAGRYVEFDIHPLEYREFLGFHQLKPGKATLMKYLRFGGMPHLARLGLDPEVTREYLANIVSTVLLKDVVARENIRNVHFLERLLQYLADNVGNLFSANNISRYLKSQRVQLNVNTLLQYLKAFDNAFLVHRVPRLDVRGLRLFEVGEKVYFEDLGIRNAIRTFDPVGDIGKLIENAVYLKLVQNQFKVQVGQDGAKEIDFVATRGEKRIYLQACYLIADDATREREFGNLLAIPDNETKMVVSMDELPHGTRHKGVRHWHLEEFLRSDPSEW
jgi:predicted AAA+ superfamily ATPase